MSAPPAAPPPLVPPPVLKAIAQFLQRAAQLDAADAVMAYHCRMYAAQKALGIHAKMQPQTAEVKKFLVALLDKLEADKKEIAVLLSQEDMKQKYAANFALKVFKLADDSDRAGTADKNTVKNFMAAVSFFEVTSQFGELPEEYEYYMSCWIKKMNKYAKWRATQIGHAVRDGTPVPPPPSDTNAPSEANEDHQMTDAHPSTAPPTDTPSGQSSSVPHYVPSPSSSSFAAPPPSAAAAPPPSVLPPPATNGDHAPMQTTSSSFSPAPPPAHQEAPHAPSPAPAPFAPLYDPMEDLASQLPQPPGAMPNRPSSSTSHPAVPPPHASAPAVPYTPSPPTQRSTQSPAQPSWPQQPPGNYVPPPQNPAIAPHTGGFPSKGVSDFMPPAFPQQPHQSNQYGQPASPAHQQRPPAPPGNMHAMGSGGGSGGPSNHAQPQPLAAAPKQAAPKQHRSPQIIYNPNDYIPLNYNIVNGYSPPPDDLIQAEKLSRHAASALQFEDVPAAIKNLINALNLLTGQAQK